MTISVSNTSNTNSLYYLIDRVNELSDAMSNKVLTVDSDDTTGNAHLDGTLSVVNLVSNTISGGNNSTSANLYINTNTIYSNTSYIYIGSNIYANSTTIVSGNVVVNTTTISVEGSVINSAATDYLNNVTVTRPVINVQTSGTSAQIVDYFTSASYRTSEYVVSIKDNGANAFQSSKMLVLHDGGTPYISEYGIIYSNTSLGTFTANANATHVRLLFTPTVANCQIKGAKLLIPT